MIRAARLALAAGLFLAGAAWGHPPDPDSPRGPDFEPPPAGSYALPPIQLAPDGQVLDERGRGHPLTAFSRGRITLLGLVYTRCGDANGCPVATWAFGTVRRMLRDDPALEARTRLVTLSFDPVHDAPPVMVAYKRRMGGTKPGAPWHFLTTASRAALDPILEGFGQDLRVAAGSRALPGTEAFTHTLKVFLIDPEGRVREIYATAWLMPRMILNDIRTLDGERTTGTR